MSRYHTDTGGSVPAYLQLYKGLREEITGGVYAYGERLPSKRQLAEDTGTSVITVEHAYQLLIDEGYAGARERSGYFVTFREKNQFPVGKQQDLPAVPHITHVQKEEEFSFASYARTARKVLTKYGESILVKSQNFGCPELRSVLASYLARSRGMHVTPDRIVIGSGAEYLYGLIVQMLGRDKIYGLEDPSYLQIRKVYEANGASCEMLKMGRRGIMSGALADAEAEVLHVTPYNSYPSGVTADASKRREYIDWALLRGAVIIEDDVDSEFTMSMKSEDTLYSLEPKRTVIYLNTFSRTIASSMRLGYMVLPEETAEELKKKIDFYSCTVPVFDQYILAEFIGSGDFERHINRVRRLRRKKHQLP